MTPYELSPGWRLACDDNGFSFQLQRLVVPGKEAKIAEPYWRPVAYGPLDALLGIFQGYWLNEHPGTLPTALRELRSILRLVAHELREAQQSTIACASS